MRDLVNACTVGLADAWMTTRCRDVGLCREGETRTILAGEHREHQTGEHRNDSDDHQHGGSNQQRVDRSAAYAARYAAKNVVAAGLAKKCEIQLSYAIGVAQPTSIAVDTFGTGKLSDTKLVEILRENFDFRPAGIIKMLDLRRPIYKQTAAYGHFGRNDLDLPWEKLDKVDDLKKYL